MHARGGDPEEFLKVGLSGGSAVERGVRGDEREVLALLVGEFLRRGDRQELVEMI